MLLPLLGSKIQRCCGVEVQAAKASKKLLSRGTHSDFALTTCFHPKEQMAVDAPKSLDLVLLEGVQLKESWLGQQSLGQG